MWHQLQQHLTMQLYVYFVDFKNVSTAAKLQNLSHVGFVSSIIEKELERQKFYH